MRLSMSYNISKFNIYPIMYFNPPCLAITQHTTNISIEQIKVSTNNLQWEISISRINISGSVIGFQVNNMSVLVVGPIQQPVNGSTCQ